MPVTFGLVLFLSFLSPAHAQTGVAGGLGLLAVQAQVTADAEAPAPPSTEETLAAVDRVLALWPELVGKLPKEEPRYNAADIGHVASCTRVNFVVRKVMVSKMISGMQSKGITIPPNPTSGSPRPVDLDDNGGAKRTVSRAALEALQEDTDLVRRFFDACIAKGIHKDTPQPDGLSVADWHKIRKSVEELGPKLK